MGNKEAFDKVHNVWKKGYEKGRADALREVSLANAKLRKDVLELMDDYFINKRAWVCLEKGRKPSMPFLQLENELIKKITALQSEGM